MIKLSVVIPCYNESKSIPRLLDACYRACAGRTDIQFIFVNNGSIDDTQQVLERLLVQNHYTFGKLVWVPINLGYGHGILKGLEAAEGQILSWTHADLQTDPIDVVNAYNLYRQELELNNCIVKGERKGRNLFDSLFTAGMSIFSTIVLNQKLQDINAQPKIFHKDFLKNLKNPPIDFSLDLYLLFIALKNQIPVKKIPVFFFDREFGDAKGGGTLRGKARLIKRTIKYILQLKEDLKTGNR